MRTIKGKTIGKDGLYPDMAERKGDKVYPSFYINIEHLPEAKDWKPGKKYDVSLRLKMTGINIRKHEGKNKDFGEANFEIHGVECHGEVKKEPKRYSRVAKKK